MAQLTIQDIMAAPSADSQDSAGVGIADVMNPPVGQNFDPLAGTTAAQRLMIGTGRRLVDLGRGAQQLAGRAGLLSRARRERLQAAIDESARLNKPLDKDLAASAGSILADVALGGGLIGAGRVASRVGAAQLGKHLAGATYKGAATTGAAVGAAEPTASGNESGAMLNAALGGVGGTAGLAIGNVAGRGVNALRGRFSQHAPARALDLAARQVGVDLSLPSLTGSAYRDATTSKIVTPISPTLESAASLVDPFLFTKRGRDREAAQVAELLTSARRAGPDDAKAFVEGIVRQFRSVEGQVNQAYDALRQEVIDKRFQTLPVVADAARESLQKLYRSFPQVLSKRAGLVPEEARSVMGRLLGDVREDLSGFLVHHGDQLSDGARRRLEAKVDGDKIVTVQQLRRLMDGLPPNLQAHLQTALSADRRTMSFDEAIALRRAMGGILGQLTKQESAGTASPFALRGMKQIYGSLVKDIDQWGGQTLNRSVMDEFKRANDLYRDSLLPFYDLPKFKSVLDAAEPDAATGRLVFDWTEYNPDMAIRDFLKKGQPELVAGLFGFSDAPGRAAGARVLEDAVIGLEPPTKATAAGIGMARSNIPPTPVNLDVAAQGYEDALAIANPAALDRTRTLSNILRAAQPTWSGPFDAFPLTLGAVVPLAAFTADSLASEGKDPPWDTALYTLGALGTLGLAGRSLRTRPIKSLALADRPQFLSGIPVVPAASGALSALSAEE